MSPTIILVVDDDPDIRDALKLTLEEGDRGVETAANGKEALDAVRERVPDLILLDLMMPVMSGAEFLTAIRADDRFRDVPVVILSAWPQEAAAIQGAQGFVAKPAPITEILELVDKHCR